MFQFFADIGRASLNLLRETRGTDTDSEEATSWSLPSSSNAPSYKEKYVPGNKLSRTKSYDKETLEKIEEYATRTRELVREWGPYREIREVLEGSPDVTETVNLRDHNGYNLLQYAIIANRPNVVQYLVRKGAEVNLPMCGRPLHLAAKLGLTEIIRILLEYNADPEVMSTVCHPGQHVDSKIVYTEEQRWYTVCVNDLYNPDGDYPWLFDYPLYYAISSDNVDCVKLCLQRGITHLITKASPLHVACSLGSFHCVQFFLEHCRKDLHVLDKKGELPIQAAVSYGKHFVEYLVLKGASVLVNNSQNETLLHILYNEAEGNIGIADTTAYLLDCGLSMKINTVDNAGNSALHMLLRRLQRCPPKCCSKAMIDAMNTNASHPETDSSDDVENADGDQSNDKSLPDDAKEIHEDPQTKEGASVQVCEEPTERGMFDTLCLMAKASISKEVSQLNLEELRKDFQPEEVEYIQSMDLLLSAGANPNISNSKTGDTSLHMLARVASKPHVDAYIPNVYCSFKLVYKLLELLLNKGANHRLMNNAQSSVLGLFVVKGCEALFTQRPGLGRFDLPDEAEVENFIRCLRLFKEHRGEFHPVGYLGSECLIHKVLCHIHDIEQLNQAGFTLHEQQTLARVSLGHVLSVLETLLECGCRPNVCKFVQSDLHNLYYNLVSRRTILPLDLLQKGILMMLQHAADPNIGGKHIPMSVFRYRSSHAYWPVYPLLHVLNTIGSREVKDKEEDFFALFNIFYNSMDESNARQCLFHYLEYDRYRGRTSKYPELDNYLMGILNNPRTLKQICASYVFAELAQRHVNQLEKLPLPITMKKYILSFQY